MQRLISYAFLSVLAHEEDKGDDCADQPADVGEVGVHLVELPLVFLDIGSFFEDDLGVGDSLGGKVVAVTEGLGDPCYILNEILGVGHYAGVCLYDAGFEVDCNSGSNGVGEQK